MAAHGPRRRDRAANPARVPGLQAVASAVVGALWGGEGQEVGKKTLAALVHANSHLSRHGVYRLPRARRALIGWSKAVPGRTRQPCPWLALMALVGALAREGCQEAALMCVLMYAL